VLPCLQASSAATADDPTVDLSQLDVAAVMFDSAEPASFRQAVQLLVGLSGRAGDSLPFVLIAAKDDLGMSNVSNTVDCGVSLMFVGCYSTFGSAGMGDASVQRLQLPASGRP
jgi:hypothetical protein